MQPNYYSNIELRSYAGIAIPVLAGKVMEKMHVYFSQHPDTYALALPAMQEGSKPITGNILRVFASERDALDDLMAMLEEMAGLKDLLSTGRIRKSPELWGGQWTEYKRFRIPARQGKGAEHQEKRLRLRAKRLAEAQFLPYLMLSSSSTRQNFTLIIKQERHQAPIVSSPNRPDSYGLARTASPVLLPDLL